MRFLNPDNPPPKRQTIGSRQTKGSFWQDRTARDGRHGAQPASLGDQWKVDPHGRSLTNLAVRRDVSAGLFHKSIDRAQPQPRAGLLRFRGVKRLEGVLPHFRRHATPVSLTVIRTYCPGHHQARLLFMIVQMTSLQGVCFPARPASRELGRECRGGHAMACRRPYAS